MPSVPLWLSRSLLFVGLVGCLCGGARRAQAQAQPLPTSQASGFRLERYEPTTAGSPLFLVDRPWYAPQKRVAASLTLGYAHRSLVFSDDSGALPPIVEHALTGWVDVAGSPLPFLLLRGSLPVTLLERGTTDARAGITPLDGASLGDPRLGAMFALWRRPEQHPLSLHLGVDAWLPISSAYARHQGDATARFLPRAVLAGTLRRALRWTFDAGFQYRGDAVLGRDGRAIASGSEVQLGAALAFVSAAERLHLAVEGRFAARVTQTSAPTNDLLRGQLWASAQYCVGTMLQLGAALGSDFATPGSPDLRALLRVAVVYRPQRDVALAQTATEPTAEASALGSVASPSAPRTSATAATQSSAAVPSGPSDDADQDGIVDNVDRCPYEPETRNGIRDDDGCPESPLALQTARALRFQAPAAATAAPSAVSAAPTRPASSPPPAQTATAPGQAVAPSASPPSAGAAIPVAPPALSAPAAPATPEDSDRDGIPDEEDRCPISAEDKDQFEDDDGCPDPDNDEDGISDAQDRCPLEAETQNGHEDEDGCPDVAPASAPQAQVSAEGDRIEVNQQVQFKRRQAELDPVSYPLLRAVARILRAHPKVALLVQGHTDSGGNEQRNQALSQQRADSVRDFLIKEGIAAERLQARGYGASQPRYSNDTSDGRSRNRRVEFVLQGDSK